MKGPDWGLFSCPLEPYERPYGTMEIPRIVTMLPYGCPYGTLLKRKDEGTLMKRQEDGTLLKRQND